MRSKLVLLGIVGLLAGIYLALYLPALSYPYEFDDVSNVIENRAVRHLPHPRIFFETEQSRIRPLTSVSFAISYAISGLSLSALRAPNLVFHALNALMVGLFFFRLFRRRRSAAFAALLAGGIFLLHPLATDSVVYLSGRASLMVLFFLLSALWCYGRTRPGIFSWLGFMVSAAAALLTKESGLALLPLLLLYHLYLKRRWRELLPYCLPLLAGGAAGALLKWKYFEGMSQGLFRVGGDVSITSVADYWPIALAQWPAILRIFFRPDLQSIDHQLVVPLSWADFHVVVGFLLWATVPFLIYGLRRRGSAVLFCALWVFGSLSVTNSFIPILDPFAERHIYLALPAFAWLAAAACLLLLEQRRRFFWLLPFCFLGFGAYAATAPRIKIWSSAESLWLDAYQKYPRKMRIVYNTWFALSQKMGGEERALPLLVHYLDELEPGSIKYEEQEVLVRMAAASLQSKVVQNGGEIFRDGAQALGAKSEFWRDAILLSAGTEAAGWLKEWGEAMLRSEIAETKAPGEDPDFRKNFLRLLRAEYFRLHKNSQAAAADYEFVLRQFPRKASPYWSKREELGDLYLAEGNDADALDEYELVTEQYRASKNYPVTLYEKLAKLYIARKNYSAASNALGQALKASGDNVELRQRYAELLRANGDKSAMSQTKEAEYYSEHEISPLDLNEAVRP